jgi:hypothetical protein
MEDGAAFLRVGCVGHGWIGPLEAEAYLQAAVPGLTQIIAPPAALDRVCRAADSMTKRGKEEGAPQGAGDRALRCLKMRSPRRHEDTKKGEPAIAEMYERLQQCRCPYFPPKRGVASIQASRSCPTFPLLFSDLLRVSVPYVVQSGSDSF